MTTRLNDPTLPDEASPAIDATGETTLGLFRENDAYTEFLWRALSSLCTRSVEGRVLEVGSGIGNLTRVLLRSPDVEFLHAIDLDPAYVEVLRRELPDPRLRVAAAKAEEFCPEEFAGDRGGFDFIVSSNVLEHIEDDRRTVSNFERMLRSDGRILLLVPAHRWLFCELDRGLSHFRRYRRRDIMRLAEGSGLRVLALRHFNPLATLGWWYNGSVLRRRILPAGQLAWYSRFAIPVSAWLDRWNPFPFGVSLLAVLGRASSKTSEQENLPQGRGDARGRGQSA